MKPITRSLTHVAASILLAFASAASADDSANLQPAPAPQGEVARGTMTATFVEGAATVRTSGSAPEAPLAQGAALHEGDVVRTGAGGRVEVTLGTGTILRIGESSRVEMRTASRDGSSFSARLALGNLWAKVHKLLAGDSFHVETENGVAGVRGTEFRVEAAKPGGHDVVRVYEGAVDVRDHASTWTHRIEPGRELAFHRGVAPAGPRPFDPASESHHPFMRWVRERPARAAPEQNRPGEHRPPERKPPEQQKPEHKQPEHKQPDRRQPEHRKSNDPGRRLRVHERDRLQHGPRR